MVFNQDIRAFIAASADYAHIAGLCGQLEHICPAGGSECIGNGQGREYCGVKLPVASKHGDVTGCCASVFSGGRPQTANLTGTDSVGHIGRTEVSNPGHDALGVDSDLCVRARRKGLPGKGCGNCQVGGAVKATGASYIAGQTEGPRG